MNRYQKYKDSGVQWIGEIPSHWEVKRNKYFTSPYDVRTLDGSGELLSVSEYRGVVPRRDIKEDGELSRSESLEGYKCVKPNHLVSNIMLMWKRGLGVSSYEGIVSPAYSVFEFVEGLPRYYHYLFRTDLYTSEFRRNSTGVIESRLRLYDDKFGSIHSHVPPLPEQHQIVSFLDEKTSLIDDLINKKEQKIGLLKEYRTSLINRVITKGLNPDCPMKDSGVEWIGMIPSHWDVKRIKNILSNEGFRSGPFGSSLITSELSDSGEILVYTPEHLTDSAIEHQQFVPTDRIEELSKYLIHTGDIVLPIVGTLGRGKLFRDTDKPGILNQRLCRITPNRKVISPDLLLWYLTKTNLIKVQIDIDKKGSILDHITKEVIFNLCITYPPLPEQEQIVSFLDEKTSEIDRTIQSEQKKIELLKEYRQSLISSVITGKIKVVN